MTPDEVLATVEMTGDLADRLNLLKTNLEERGWSPAAAQHASVTLMNTMMAGSMMAGPR